MFARRFSLLFVLAAVAVLVTACSGEKTIPQASSVDTLAEALKASGLHVNGPLPNDVLSSRYFSVPGVSFEASGEKIHAYEFESEEAAMQERALVSSDGYGIGSKYVNWSIAPNFYNNGRLIVIYDGDESLLKKTLSSAMGERFAGSDPA